MKKTRPNPRANKNILWFAYGVVGVFAAMGLYMGAFLQFQSEDVINNPYNARIAGMADRVVRGKLLADDGTVIAETVVGEDGKETRSYPYGELFAHVAGYSTMGKTGLESLVNFHLLSSHVNLMEKIIDELSGEKSTGDNVATTLNLRLQQTAWDALGDRRGAVIAMEPDTGKVLAMVSKPAFDPNTVEAEWDSLVNGDSKEARLLNRATQGLYPPGSTFKVITALEYMREHPGAYDGFHFSCDGIYEYENIRIQCYHKTAHGEEDFAASFANSCNGAFASLGLELDLDGLKGLSEQLLFNRDQPLSIPYKQSVYQMEADAEDWEIMQTAMGQGSTLMTPMHNLMLISAVANGGTLMKPYFIDRVENVGGQTIKKFMPSSAGSLMSAGDAGLLTEFLTDVVTEGTGSAVRTDAYTVAGKTGSAEFETGKETHAWFVGFAPAEDPKVAVCVLVEESGSGGQVAAPIARAIFDWAASMDSGEEESE